MTEREEIYLAHCHHFQKFSGNQRHIADTNASASEFVFGKRLFFVCATNTFLYARQRLNMSNNLPQQQVSVCHNLY